ncbi:MAG: phytoene desaturase family protein [Bacteroidota bacterium]|nr:phytoene desaturase family protein [Bacteroidota bacterium]
MSEKKSAIVIGAGVGGIATAIQLAQHGYSVKIFEKNPNPGGRCGQIVRDGHTFDLGATIVLMPGIYRDVFKMLGLSFEECLEAKPLPVIYQLHYADGTIFDFTTNEDRMQSQLEAIEPGSFQQFGLYVAEGYKMFQLALQKLLGRNFYHWFEFVNFGNIKLLFDLKTHIRQATYVQRFFKDQRLKTAFSFQNIYVGQNPFKAPALFAMLPAAEISEGSFCFKGGMYSVVEKLLTVAAGLGVECECNKPVARIVVDKHSAKGVIFEDGSYVRADLVVANADLPYVYRDLLPGKCQSAWLDHLDYSCSAITFHWGLDKQYPQLADHCVFLSEDYREGLNKLFDENSMSDAPSFYVHAPVGNDPSAAPEQQDSISIIIPVGKIEARQAQDWDQLKQTARHYVIERLKKEGLTDIEAHIKFEICYNPQTWNTNCHITKGAVFGSVSHHITQMGYFRPHNRHNRYKNLYFVGGSTHPGNGIPLVLLSSKLTTERILKEQTNK